MSGDRDLDLVLLGATGFTGRLTAHRLAERLAGTGTRWAVAGRDRERLAAIAAEVPGDPSIEVVDVTDLVGLLELTARTRVLATTVGPYRRFGELVVQACVRNGTHYADITGEPAFVELVRARYHADAAARGVKLVSCCGFDSVPHDLGARFTVDHLPDDAPLTVRGYVRYEGRMSGGTARTALDAIAEGTRSAVRSRADGPAREADGRPVRTEPPTIHRVAALRAWGVPLPTIDASIVLRSARELDGYGTSFRYGHYALVRRLPVALGGVAAVGAGVAAASVRPGRAVLERVLPAPGAGPDEQRRARSRFQVSFVGRGGGRRVLARVSGGDGGYAGTADWLTEAMLVLLEDHATTSTSNRAAGGALTPAVGLGEPFHRRLVATGLRFELLDEVETGSG